MSVRFLPSGLDLPFLRITVQHLYRHPDRGRVARVTELLRKAMGSSVKRLAVMAPGFSADCVETLEEVNEEIKEAFLEAGGEKFAYIPCLNADGAHIDMLFEIIKRNLSGWL